MRYALFHALRIPKLSVSTTRYRTAFNSYLITPPIHPTKCTKPATTHRCLHISPFHHQNPSPSSGNPPLHRPTPNPHTNFYRTHGRALLKALTLAFFTYQVVYWAWLTLDTEETKAEKSREIEKLEGEVRLLDEGRKGGLTVEGGKG